jgi:hypothetical protein
MLAPVASNLRTKGSVRHFSFINFAAAGSSWIVKMSERSGTEFMIIKMKSPKRRIDPRAFGGVSTDRSSKFEPMTNAMKNSVTPDIVRMNPRARAA